MNNLKANKETLIKVMKVILKLEESNTITNKDLDSFYEILSWKNTSDSKYAITWDVDNFSQDKTDSLICVYYDDEKQRGMRVRDKLVGTKEEKIKALRNHMWNTEDLYESLLSI